MSGRGQVIPAGHCLKCKQKVEIIESELCKDCFVPYFVHKFRLTFGKNTHVDLNAKRVLLSFNGSNKSFAMLVNALDGLKTATPKRFRFELICLYIDFPRELIDSDESNRNKLREGREQRLQLISSLLDAADCDIPVYCMAFEQVCATGPFDPEKMCVRFGNSGSRCDHLCQSAALYDCTDLHGGLSHLLNVTMRDDPSAARDLVELLTDRLMVRVAKALDCHAILVSSSSDDLACDLLVRFATGRGAQVPAATRFDDARFAPNGAIFLRPLMLVRDAEVRAYLSVTSAKTHSPTFLESDLRLAHEALVDDGGANAKRSIHAVTREFVDNLQAGFRATVFTALRSGEKIEIRQKDLAQKCALCNALIIDEEPQRVGLHDLCASCGRIAKRVTVNDTLSWLLVQPV